METSLPLIAFVVAATVTPGPNNLMVLASGANWGSPARCRMSSAS